MGNGDFIRRPLGEGLECRPGDYHGQPGGRVEVACITLWQPYASLIFAELKCFETRGFKAPSRLVGDIIAIHAAARPLSQCGVSAGLDALCRATYGPDYAATLPRGALLGAARVVECAPVEKYRDQISEADYLAGDWSDGRFCWLLADVRPLPEARPMKGKQGWSRVHL